VGGWVGQGWLGGWVGGWVGGEGANEGHFCKQELRRLASLTGPRSPLLPLWRPPAGGMEGFGHAQGLSLLKSPRGFEPVWEDESSYADVRLVLWRPIPYPG
jgi:hypothetical protein